MLNIFLNSDFIHSVKQQFSHLNIVPTMSSYQQVLHCKIQEQSCVRGSEFVTFFGRLEFYWKPALLLLLVLFCCLPLSQNAE